MAMTSCEVVLLTEVGSHDTPDPALRVTAGRSAGDDITTVATLPVAPVSVIASSATQPIFGPTCTTG